MSIGTFCPGPGFPPRGLPGQWSGFYLDVFPRCNSFLGACFVCRSEGVNCHFGLENDGFDGWIRISVSSMVFGLWSAEMQDLT